MHFRIGSWRIIVVILGGAFIWTSALASLFESPPAETQKRSNSHGIDRPNLGTAFTDSRHLTGIPASTDPRYAQGYTGGLGFNTTTPFYVQPKPNLALSAGSFLFDLFTGKGNRSFTEQLFDFIGSRLFSPIKTSFSGITNMHGGLGSLDPASHRAAVATMRDPYSHLLCPQGGCDPLEMLRQQKHTEDIFNYLQGGSTSSRKRLP